MFERFTDQARQVVVHAQERARALGHDSIESAHLALGVLEVPDGVGITAIGRCDTDDEPVRAALLTALGPGGPGDRRSEGIPFTADAKRVLGDSLQVALADGISTVDDGHVLQALYGDPTVGPVLAEALPADRLGAALVLVRSERPVAPRLQAARTVQMAPAPAGVPALERIEQQLTEILARLEHIERRLDDRP